jgi:RNase P subunit RPR2
VAITYTLYCKSCYDRLNETEEGKAAKARPHKSYFVCSCCSCETDRGFAVQNGTQFEPHAERHMTINVS